MEKIYSFENVRLLQEDNSPIPRNPIINIIRNFFSGFHVFFIELSINHLWKFSISKIALCKNSLAKIRTNQ